MSDVGTVKESVVWVVVRDDHPDEGEWFVKERIAFLKQTWLREQGISATVYRAVMGAPRTAGGGR